MGIKEGQEFNDQQSTPDDYRASERRTPQYTRLTFNFAPHEIRPPHTRSSTEERLESYYRSAFKINERNIAVMEDSSDKNKSLGPYFAITNNQYGNHTESFAAAVYLRDTGRTPIQPIKGLVETLNNFDNPTVNYMLSKYSALDKLISEGYNIDVVFEEPTEGISEWPAGTYKSKEEIRAHLISQTESNTKRDQTLIRQLNSLVEQAESASIPTNILVLRGSAHEAMILMLDETYKPIINYFNEGVHPREGRQGNFDRLNYEMMMKLRRDVVVSKKDWDKFFQKIGRR